VQRQLWRPYCETSSCPAACRTATGRGCRKRRRNGEVLHTSGYTDNAIVHQGRLDPGVLLLTKPYRKSQLADTIRRALNGGAA
jgi:hypothetical protein